MDQINSVVNSAKISLELHSVQFRSFRGNLG